MIQSSNPGVQALWKHFEKLSAIPRVSEKEQAAGDYVLAVAKARGLEARRDDYGNILVTKPATPGMESRPAVVLQSHLDMVPQKVDGSAHDFLRDPLRLVSDGEWVKAVDTTLGADNGMGVCAALALLESRDIPHGPLSGLFTVEEEIGLRGAAKVKADFLPGDLLLNLDADAPDELTIGCAGAMDLRVELPVRRQVCPASWVGLQVTLGGLQGGHSGGDIHLGRGNAIRLLARLLANTGLDPEWRLARMEGGDARNAIPRQALAVVACPVAGVASLQARLQVLASQIAAELSVAEPGLFLRTEAVPVPSQVLDWPSAQTLLDLIRAAADGVIRFSEVQPGVVETSSNLGILKLGEEGPAYLQHLLRSLVDSAKAELGSLLHGLYRLGGAQVRIFGDYPGWKPDTQSRLLPLFAETCERLQGRKPRILVVHGGLECGILRALKPTMDCISYGPRIEHMHSPAERVNIASVDLYFRTLVEVLARL